MRRFLKALQAEQVQIVPATARLHQVGHDLSNYAAELETVSGEPGGNTDLWQFWVQVEDEMLIGGIGEEAGFEGHRWACGVREIA